MFVSKQDDDEFFQQMTDGFTEINISIQGLVEGLEKLMDKQKMLEDCMKTYQQRPSKLAFLVCFPFFRNLVFFELEKFNQKNMSSTFFFNHFKFTIKV